MTESQMAQHHTARCEHVEIPEYEDYLKAQKITVKDIKDHLTGPVVSAIAHIIILSILPYIVFMEHKPETATFTVQVQNLEIKPIDKIPEPPEPPDNALKELEVAIDSLAAAADVSVEVDTAATSSVNTAEMSLIVDVPDLITSKLNNSALTVPAIYSANRSKSARLDAINRHTSGKAASPEEIEKSVEKALAWLAENQNEDGSWGVCASSKYSYTALAALAFLGHGETPGSQKYGQNIVRALKKMLEWVDKDSCIRNDWYSYDHAIVAYTISEAYGITKMPKLKDAMNKTMAYIINNQNKRGTFSYGYDRVPVIQYGDRDPVTGKLFKGRSPEPPSNLAFSGWNYQALKSAFSAGCDLPGLQEAVDNAKLGIKRHENPNKKEGGFSENRSGNPDFGMTSVGILCLGLLGDGEGREARRAMEWMQKHNANGMKTCAWRYNADVHKEYPKAFTHALFTWYYQTQVIFQYSKGRGSVWDRWNRAFSKAYIQEQNEDGSWLTPAEKYGSHLDSKKVNAEWHYVKEYSDEKDLRLYATTLCCLTLEVYYHYLPTYHLPKIAEKKVSIVDSDEKDLGLKIE